MMATPLVLLVYIMCVQTFTQAASAATQPNIVFILADDFGFNDVGYHGSEIHTPTIDALAASGVRLENYYVQPICTPTRSQLMSGRYQIHTGLQHGVLGNPQANGLPLNSPTLADKMKESGYDTHMIGKWHLGFYKKEYMPFYRGFDTYYGYLGGEESYYTHSSNCEGHGDYLDFRDQNGPIWNEKGNYSGHLFTSKAIELIQSHNKSKPLFLYLAYQNVHAPLQVPESYTKQYDFIKNDDRRTFADNGGEINFGGNNYPLRGWKWSLWEGGLHGVGFVSGGALKTRGVVNHELIHVSDWFPTIVGLAGGSLNGTKPLDGFDQWETITKGTPSKRDVLLHNIDILVPKKGVPKYNDTWDTSVRAAIRVGDLKLITGNPYNGSWILPPGDDSLYFQPEIDEAETKNVWLFNITADPTEHFDLSDEMPDVVRQMLDMIKAANDTAVPVRYPDPDPRANPELHGGVWSPWE